MIYDNLSPIFPIMGRLKPGGFVSRTSKGEFDLPKIRFHASTERHFRRFERPLIPDPGREEHPSVTLERASGNMADPPNSTAEEIKVERFDFDLLLKLGRRDMMNLCEVHIHSTHRTNAPVVKCPKLSGSTLGESPVSATEQ